MYEIVRFYEDERPSEVITVVETKEEAKEWCKSKESHGKGWFDGWRKE